jgi:hypothetical protein
MTNYQNNPAQDKNKAQPAEAQPQHPQSKPVAGSIPTTAGKEHAPDAKKESHEKDSHNKDAKAFGDSKNPKDSKDGKGSCAA